MASSKLPPLGTSSKRNFDNITEKVSAESMPVYATLGQFSGTWTAVQGILSFTVYPSQCWWLQTPIVLTSSIDADFTLSIIPYGINPGIINPGFKISLKAGVPFSFQATQPWTEKTVMTLYGAAVNSVSANVYCGFGAVKTSNRIFNKKSMRGLIIGDSITDGTPGDIAYGAQIFTWKALSTLAPKYQFEPVHKTQASANSIHTYELLMTQRVNLNDYDMIIYEIMTNDNTTALNANYATTLDLFCALKKAEAPDVPTIICIAPSRVGSINDIVETNRIYARTKVDAIIAAGDNTFARCNLDTLWTSAQAATYTVDGLHPLAARHQDTMAPLLVTTMRKWFTA